jgi:hypothetical protein
VLAYGTVLERVYQGNFTCGLIIVLGAVALLLYAVWVFVIRRPRG